MVGGLPSEESPDLKNWTDQEICHSITSVHCLLKKQVTQGRSAIAHRGSQKEAHDVQESLEPEKEVGSPHPHYTTPEQIASPSFLGLGITEFVRIL